MVQEDEEEEEIEIYRRRFPTLFCYRGSNRRGSCREAGDVFVVVLASKGDSRTPLLGGGGRLRRR